MHILSLENLKFCLTSHPSMLLFLFLLLLLQNWGTKKTPMRRQLERKADLIFQKPCTQVSYHSHFGLSYTRRYRSFVMRFSCVIYWILGPYQITTIVMFFFFNWKFLSSFSFQKSLRKFSWNRITTSTCGFNNWIKYSHFFFFFFFNSIITVSLIVPSKKTAIQAWLSLNPETVLSVTQSQKNLISRTVIKLSGQCYFHGHQDKLTCLKFSQI